ncbi:MAG: protein kinase, partial [Acidobacteriota bacterium]
MIGKTLNHYKILRAIGSGGMGEVYAAEDTKLHRQVALKILPPELAGDPQRRERFEREAQAVAALNHPNIVTIHSVEEAIGVEDAPAMGGQGAAASGFGDFGSGTKPTGSVHFITMELVEGRTLSELIPKHGMALEKFFDVAVPAVDAVAAAHQQGIAHRDLKPSNIMISDEGRVKVLDFGLAKLVDEGAAADQPTQVASEHLTGEGQVLGTAAYMSPEQAEGKLIDHRSDLFSLGIILYEMSTGERPFTGETQVSLVTSILRDTPPSITEIKQTLPRHLGRIIGHCLEKEPLRRYQSAIDLRNDLEGLRGEVESGEVLTSGISPPLAPPRARRRWWAYAAAMVILAAFIGYRQLRPDRASSATTAAVPAAEEAPSLAVLYFDNLSNDPALDWLRSGLTDMLVTDLSQSPDIRVLGTDRVYEILEQMGRLEESTTSSAAVREVAERARVSTVLLGSFMRAGEAIRINVRLQDAASGRVLTSESVEGAGEANLFAMVDDLTEHIRAKLDVAEPTEAAWRMDLEDVTTSSVQAYRYYVEGMVVHEQGNDVEAIPLLEKAVETDPQFAMALAKLSVMHSNNGDLQRAEEYGRQAVDLVERLTSRERYYIEGLYYSLREETVPRAIEAYKKAVELFPDHTSARNNLALQYIVLERYDEAIPYLEELGRQGMSFPGSYSNLAEAYSAQGEFDKGEQALRSYLDRFPDSGAGYFNLAVYLTRWGRLEPAAAALRQAESLDADYPWLPVARYEWNLLAERRQEAEEEADAMLASESPPVVQVGAITKAEALLYRGRLEDAIGVLRQRAQALPEHSLLRADLYNIACGFLLQAGDAERALRQAELAQRHGERYDAEIEAIARAAVALASLGRGAEAETRAEEYRRRLAARPGKGAERTLHRFEGTLALASDETDRALEQLHQADALLPAHSPSGGPGLSDHAPIWF